MSPRVALTEAMTQATTAAAAVQLLRHGSNSKGQEMTKSLQASAAAISSDTLAPTAQQHCADLAEIFSLTSGACWQAIEQGDKLRPQQWQAFLQVFLTPLLFTADAPLHMR